MVVVVVVVIVVVVIVVAVVVVSISIVSRPGCFRFFLSLLLHLHNVIIISRRSLST